MKDEQPQEPKKLLNLLRWVCPEHLAEEIEGDLIQKFYRNLKTSGSRKAKVKLFWSIVRYFRPGIFLRRKHTLSVNNLGMLIHYFRTMMRGMVRNKSYTMINVLGLTLGITCALTIFLYVHDELTFDHNHRNIEKIYRLNGGWRSMTDGTSTMYPGVGYIVGDVLRKDFPEVDELVRVQRWSDVQMEIPGKDEHQQETIYRADSNVFKVFTFPFLAGNPENALTDHHSLVISEKMALKYFNKTDVVGETLRWFMQDTVVMKITGVMETPPDNTQFKVDFLVKIREPQNLDEEWFEYRYWTFFTLKPNANIGTVEDRIKFFTKRYVADLEKEIGFTQEHSITPLARVHLHSHLAGESNPRASFVYIFMIVGLFILFMGCINFINLGTARAVRRAKEIGIRKVMGAVKSQLVRQFLGEAFVLTLIAAALSIMIVYAVLPVVNSFSGKAIDIVNHSVFWFSLASIIVVVTLLAGGYPSFVLAVFKPAETLKGNFRNSAKGLTLRKNLVIFQFSVSIALIAGTFIIVDHLAFLRGKDLGFDKDQVLILTNASPATKDKILAISGVSNASFSNRVPGMSVGGRTIIKGWNKNDPQFVVGQLVVDHDFVDLFKLQLIEGRNFSMAIPSDQQEAFLLNESAMHRLGFANADQAIGTPLWLDEDWGGKKGRIIGVVKDFHFIGVNAAIEPFAMFLHPNARRFLSVKISSPDLPGVIQQIEHVFRETSPNRTFEYSFLDQNFDKQYQAEDRFMTIFSYFAVIGILIGCLGLYGLAMFMAEQRTKEVGIRKVLGASSQNILSLLTSDFLKLVAVSFVLAIPVAYFGMQQWLNGFPYRRNIDPMIFVFTGLAVLVITLVTVTYQALRAALTNPVNTLRME